MSQLLLGDEAVGLAAIDAGISGVFSCPGTPASGVRES
jgi:TPP-dependent indolepyruvate ferredoxin oxidoreductase alpha subunit